MKHPVKMPLLLPVIFLTGIFALMSACDKKSDDPDGPTLAVVVTDAPIGSTLNTATVGGHVTDNGGTQVTDRGICYSLQSTPTLNDMVMPSGSGLGTFTVTLTGLNPATLYYYRAYVVNSVGISYGEQQTVTTQANPGILPTVTTATISAITGNTASGGGNVTEEGSEPVIKRGVCWSSSPAPTLEDQFTEDGSGPGTYTSNLTGLDPLTTYYVRAYATSSVGTSYGNEVNFKTEQSGPMNIPCPGTPTVTWGEKTYNTVLIGNQCWFRENLNYGVMIDSTQQMSDNQIVEKYCYRDDPTLCETYGALYQWNEVMQYVTTEGAQGICPDGWHVPTHLDYVELTSFLDGLSVAGGKMKEEGTVHWISPNVGATNESGFTVVGGGYYSGNPGAFYKLREQAWFWTSTLSGTKNPGTRSLGNNYTGVGKSTQNKWWVYGIGCIKNQ